MARWQQRQWQWQDKKVVWPYHSLRRVQRTAIKAKLWLNWCPCKVTVDESAQSCILVEITASSSKTSIRRWNSGRLSRRVCVCCRGIVGPMIRKLNRILLPPVLCLRWKKFPAVRGQNQNRKPQRLTSRKRRKFILIPAHQSNSRQREPLIDRIMGSKRNVHNWNSCACSSKAS